MTSQLPHRAARSRVRVALFYVAAAAAGVLSMLVVLAVTQAMAGDMWEMSELAWGAWISSVVVALVVIAAAYATRGQM